MTDQNQIAPPPELRRQWQTEVPLPAHFHGVPLIPPVDCVDPQSWIAQRIYDMGYDQRGEVNEAELQQARDEELEACCEEMNEWGGIHNSFGGELADDLRAARRPKPPSLKEQAMQAILHLQDGAAHSMDATESADTIRRALEALPDD